MDKIDEMDLVISDSDVKIKQQKVHFHFLYWFLYFVFFGVFMGKFTSDLSEHMIKTGLKLPFIMVATYISVFGIFPFYLKSKKLFPGIVAIVALLAVTTFGERIIILLLEETVVSLRSLFDADFLYFLLEAGFVVGIAIAIRFHTFWKNDQEQKYRMEQQNLENELNLLRSQLHPHFLFNTMNNLYALSLENATRTSEGIAKISDLLRTVLYECNEREIELVKEIELIKNYIELEKMRYAERLNLELQVDGDIEDWIIAPMILFTFVENCFKHGCSKVPEKPFVRINLQVSAKELRFRAENNIACDSGSEKKKSIEGIGLNNVKKRLEILYPNKYELHFNFDNNTFKVDFNLSR